jgi:hypothetical protein
MRLPHAIWAHERILAKNEVFDTGNAKFRHQGEEPTERLTQRVFKAEFTASFVAIERRQEPAYLNEVGECGRRWPICVP